MLTATLTRLLPSHPAAPIPFSAVHAALETAGVATTATELDTELRALGAEHPASRPGAMLYGLPPFHDLPACPGCHRSALIADSLGLPPGHLRCAAGCGWEGARPAPEVEQARRADGCWEQVTMGLAGGGAR